MADLAEVAGSVAGAASSGPLGGIALMINAAKGIIGEFVTSPEAKLNAQVKLAELQISLQTEQMDAVTKQIQASAGANSDHYLGGVRAYFCYGVSSLFIWNWGVGPALKFAPVAIPAFVVATFATIMLGFVGVPAGIEMAKQIAAMPGDSSVSVLGFKAANNSVCK
jgi:hypothetical protein